VDIDRIIEFTSNHWIMSSGLVIVTLLLVQDLFDSLLRKYKVISPSEVVSLLNDDRTLLIDVREPHEFANGHIENARHIPYGRLDEKVYELEPYKDSPVVVVCQTGTRSQPACKKLSKLGFHQLYEMKGGMLAWQDLKLPVSKKKK
jgi:rhodanese-related sulfurtransferase